MLRWLHSALPAFCSAIRQAAAMKTELVAHFGWTDGDHLLLWNANIHRHAVDKIPGCWLSPRLPLDFTLLLVLLTHTSRYPKSRALHENEQTFLAFSENLSVSAYQMRWLSVILSFFLQTKYDLRKQKTVFIPLSARFWSLGISTDIFLISCCAFL